MSLAIPKTLYTLLNRNREPILYNYPPSAKRNEQDLHNASYWRVTEGCGYLRKCVEKYSGSLNMWKAGSRLSHMSTQMLQYLLFGDVFLNCVLRPIALIMKACE